MINCMRIERTLDVMQCPAYMRTYAAAPEPLTTITAMS